MLPDKIVYLTKNQTAYCNCKRQFIFKWTTFQFELHNKLFNPSHAQFVFEKHICIDPNIPSLFRLNWTKVLITTTLSVPLSKQSCPWFYQSKRLLLGPFLFSSTLDHKTCPDWLIVGHWDREVWKDHFSLLKGRSQLA